MSAAGRAEDRRANANALLLPFYVNGTLGADDRTGLDLALASSAKLRAELEEVQYIAALVRAGGQTLLANPGPQKPRLDRLLAAIRTQEQDQSQPTRLLSQRPRSKWPPAKMHGRRWQLPLAASIALILAGLIAREAMVRPGGSTYQTASGPQSESPPSAAALLIVRFRQDAPWSEIEALLIKQRLTVVSGPSEGRMILRMDNGRDDSGAARKQLAASPLIEFVGQAE